MTDRITSGLSPFTDAAVVLKGHDLTGRNAIVTGGATGIGIETVRALAGAGAHVTIAVRNRAAGEAAAAEVNAKVGANRASVGMLDLSDLATVAAFAQTRAYDKWDSHGQSKTPAQGASTSVWAAVGPELEGVGGLYLEDLGQAVTFSLEARAGVMDYALDPEAAERLWALSEETTGLRVG